MDRRFADLIRGASRKELEGIVASMMADRIAWKGRALVQHRRAGRIIHEEDVCNALTLEGANSMLAVYFNAATQIAQNAWYEALYTSTPTTALTGAGATTNELTGTGYARQQVNTWTLSQVTNWRVTTPQITFTAGGSWTPVTAAAWVNSSSGAAGKALSFIALSSTRTLLINDQLLITYYIQLS